MIFYTLQGPNSKLEIHDDRMKLVKKSWWALLSRKDKVTEFELSELAQFHITNPKFIWGKIEWSVASGAKGSFRFTTSSEMMLKIEKYMNKLVIKNIQKHHNVQELKTRKSTSKRAA